MPEIADIPNAYLIIAYLVLGIMVGATFLYIAARMEGRAPGKHADAMAVFMTISALLWPILLAGVLVYTLTGAIGHIAIKAGIRAHDRAQDRKVRHGDEEVGND